MTVVKLHGATAVGNVTVAPETFRCWQSPTCGHLLSWRSPNDSTERSVLLARMRRLDVSTAEKDAGTWAAVKEAGTYRQVAIRSRLEDELVVLVIILLGRLSGNMSALV